MTECERLIDILSEIDYIFADGKRRTLDTIEFVADYLLENGVIVPPCRFNGDLRWIDDEDNVCHQTRAIKTICCHENGTFSVIDKDGNCDKIGTRYAYLTREEAEKALENSGCE